jgi:hypothetical protein
MNTSEIIARTSLLAAFDARTEAFPKAPEANRFLKRSSYQAPWIVPEKV